MTIKAKINLSSIIESPEKGNTIATEEVVSPNVNYQKQISMVSEKLKKKKTLHEEIKDLVEDSNKSQEVKIDLNNECNDNEQSFEDKESSDKNCQSSESESDDNQKSEVKEDDSNESEASEEEVSPLMSLKQLTTATMKKIQLFRRPTEDMSSPLSKGSLPNQDQIKDMIMNNDLLRSEKITQQYKQHVYEKILELREEFKALIDGIKSELTSNANLFKDCVNEEIRSLHQLILDTNNNFMESLKEEVKRRNRDKSDIFIKIGKLEESINE